MHTKHLLCARDDLYLLYFSIQFHFPFGFLNGHSEHRRLTPVTDRTHCHPLYSQLRWGTVGEAEGMLPVVSDVDEIPFQLEPYGVKSSKTGELKHTQPWSPVKQSVHLSCSGPPVPGMGPCLNKSGLVCVS